MLDNLKVSHKLFLAFSLLILLLILSNLNSYKGLNSLGQSLFTITANEAPLVDVAKEMKLSLMTGRNALEEYKGATAALLQQNVNAIDASQAAFEQSVHDFDLLATAILEGGVLANGAEVIATGNPLLAQQVTDSGQLYNHVFQAAAAELINTGKTLVSDKAEARRAMKAMKRAIEQVLELSRSLQDTVQKQLKLWQKDPYTAFLITDMGMPLFSQTLQMQVLVQQSRLALEEVAQSNTKGELKAPIADFQASQREFTELMQQSQALIDRGGRNFTDKGLPGKLDQIKARHAAMHKQGQAMIDAQRDLVHHSEQAAAAMLQLDEAGDQASAMVAQIETIAYKAMQEVSVKGRDIADSARNTILIIASLSVSLGIALGVVISRSITRPLGGEPREMMAIATEIADGNLTVSFDTNAPKDSTYGAMRAMSTKLRAMLSDIVQASTRLAAVAEQSSAATAQTRNNIDAQHQQTELVATAIQQMTATVHNIAQNTSAAAEASRTAQEQTQQGSRSLQNTSASMANLTEQVADANAVIAILQQKSQEIGQVLEVIQSIAEQTNLLALNAAIEAARAGDQGRGFAVVADEVRTLSQRTQTSAADIQQMISSVQAQAEKATAAMALSQEQAAQTNSQTIATAASFSKILLAVESINDMTLQIAAASEQQSQVAEEVNRSITEISDLALQTASGADEISGASNDVAAAAEQLNAIAHQFKV